MSDVGPYLIGIALGINTVNIEPEQVQRILGIREDHFNDMKGRRIKPAKLTKAIAAFANADGGEVYVGIEEVEPGVFEWDGFADPEDANGHLQVFEPLFPLGDGSGTNFSSATNFRDLFFTSLFIGSLPYVRRTTE